MIVIPAIDIIDGSIVRLSEGDYSRVSHYLMTPEDAAKRFEDGGLTHLHVVDLDGAEGNGKRNLRTLERIAACCSLHIDFGGGIRSAGDAESAFSAGAEKVNIGSMAVRKKEAVVELGRRYPGRIIISADVRDEKVAIAGWKEDTAIDVSSFLEEYIASGISLATVTDISKDGMLSGPGIELYSKLIEALPSLSLIASGGVSSVSDLKELSAIGVHGTIVGKAYYEGRITIAEMKEAECLQRG